MTTDASRRLGWRMGAWMGGFLAIYLVVAAAMRGGDWSGGAAAAVLLLPLLPLAGALGAAVRHHRRNADELEQRIELQAVTLTTGLLLMAATYWGLLVRFAGVPPFPLDLALPVAVLVWTVSRRVVGRAYR